MVNVRRKMFFKCIIIISSVLKIKPSINKVSTWIHILKYFSSKPPVFTYKKQHKTLICKLRNALSKYKPTPGFMTLIIRIYYSHHKILWKCSPMVKFIVHQCLVEEKRRCRLSPLTHLNCSRSFSSAAKIMMASILKRFAVITRKL